MRQTFRQPPDRRHWKVRSIADVTTTLAGSDVLFFDLEDGDCNDNPEDPGDPPGEDPGETPGEGTEVSTVRMIDR
ncbi:MAG: hypothetical protein R3C19_19220 [Planctomycetaceae bacterium]